MPSEMITVETTVSAPLEKVWECWTEPRHITGWCFAQDDWEAPHAENDLRAGGRFLTRFAAKDGSAGFDFTGTYDTVEPLRLIEYTMDDLTGDPPRTVRIEFTAMEEGVHIRQSFTPESVYPEDVQKSGWQAILDNFRKYCEAQ